ncbi:MAG: hypothetical protein LBE55_00355 [Clostridiales bacterium]|jgi:hypothetical protein|nr:hypothetical protein [Clostridiales bacterium]
MRIKNNPNIFYLACGLLVDGDRRYDQNDAEIAALAGKICDDASRDALDADILQWFNLAKAGQVETNPYWPRGHAMMMAVLFADGADFDIDRFMEFLKGINILDPVGQDEFREWIGHLPEILAYSEGIFRGFWKEYCEIMFARRAGWAPEIEASRLPLKEFFGCGNMPNLVLAPNLFADPWHADFVHNPEGTVVLIAAKPDVESMLHETLRAKIAEHSEKIAVFYKEHGEEYVTEECFVRALSTILAGGKKGRVQSHVNCGFVGVPTIVDFFEKHRPNADNLGDFIDSVLKGNMA